MKRIIIICVLLIASVAWGEEIIKLQPDYPLEVITQNPDGSWSSYPPGKTYAAKCASLCVLMDKANKEGKRLRAIANKQKDFQKIIVANTEVVSQAGISVGLFEAAIIFECPCELTEE